jgi:DNA-directed RNA polymerase specialized sigma24 family protein
VTERKQRLLAERGEALVTAYLDGVGTLELGAQFGVHRSTVNRLLKGAGVLRARAKLSQLPIAEAVRSRHQSRIYRDIAERFGVDTETVRRHI